MWVLVAGVGLLVIFWLLGGGIQKIIGSAGSFSLSIPNLLSGTSSFASFQLPFAPSVYPQIPSAYSGTDSSGGGNTYQPYQPAGTLQNGAQSPYAGEIVMTQGAAVAQSANAQYLEISAMPGISSVDIAGWTLQSALSGALATIPEAASPFMMGRVNTVSNVLLSGGGVAYVVTGSSPVGVSFSENMCTGYLGTLQPFVPALPLKCPSPLSEIPDTAANEARLGASCFSYLSQLPPCSFPAKPPQNLSSACISEIQTKLSYNGCLATHQSDPGFFTNSWRLYLAQGRSLWGVQHDVIRLLDGSGRVVSVLNY
jgi:hypothetical protein